MGEVKFCECGCGGLVSIAKYTNKKKGHKKGEPVRFISGHNQKGKTYEELYGKRSKYEKEIRSTSNKGLHKFGGRKNKGKKRPDLSKRNKIDNPMNKPGIREKVKKIQKELTNRPHIIEANRQRLLEQWKSSSFVQKQMKSRHVKPNRLETMFESWLNENFPNEWKYVGDGQIIISGKCPDFINVNGKKQIIELFGDYWHKGQNPEDRIKIFEPFGYETLVIWEKELKRLKSVKEKIIQRFYLKGSVL